jgi:hypothetical protein
MRKLRLGVIGLSEGNGHPYSWSAIFNGYDQEKMKACPFPVIPQYLAAQSFPEDFLGSLANVTHVWTQDREISESIATASKIEHVVDRAEDMIGHVDALLLARDDAYSHTKMAMPFILAGVPIFIDKPFSLSVSDAQKMLGAQQFEGQIFTCSALRYAKELFLTASDLHTLEQCKYAEGSVMKEWDTYAVHLIEPLICQSPGRGKLKSVTARKVGSIHVATIEWQNFLACIKVTGAVQVPLALTFFGKENSVTKTFKDSFSCFRESLKIFIDGLQTRKASIDIGETLEIVEIIERGRC